MRKLLVAMVAAVFAAGAAAPAAWAQIKPKKEAAREQQPKKGFAKGKKGVRPPQKAIDKANKKA